MRDKESQNKKINDLIDNIRQNIVLVRDENKTIFQEKKDLLDILIWIKNIFEKSIRFDKLLLDMVVLDKLIKKNQILSSFTNRMAYSSISIDDWGYKEKEVFLKRFRLILRDLGSLLSVKDEIISFDDVDILFNKTKKQIIINNKYFPIDKKPWKEGKYKGAYKILYYIVFYQKFEFTQKDLDYKKISRLFSDAFGWNQGNKTPSINNFYLPVNRILENSWSIWCLNVDKNWDHKKRIFEKRKK